MRQEADDNRAISAAAHVPAMLNEADAVFASINRPSPSADGENKASEEGWLKMTAAAASRNSGFRAGVKTGPFALSDDNGQGRTIY